MVRNEIINRKAGTLTKVVIKSDMTSKLNAASKHNGYRVEKITEMTCRVGIDYNNIKSVKERKAEMVEQSTRQYTNPYEVVVKNRIKKHKDTGVEYAILAPNPKSKAKTKYVIIHGSDVRTVDQLSEEDKKLFQPSAFAEHKQAEIMTVKLENIITFNGIA